MLYSVDKGMVVPKSPAVDVAVLCFVLMADSSESADLQSAATLTVMAGSPLLQQLGW